MYSSALSQPGTAAAAANQEEENEEEESTPEPDELGRATPEGERQEGTEMDTVMVSMVTVLPPPVYPVHSSVTQMLCASQTLDTVTLTPEVVPPPPPPPPLPHVLLPPPALYSPR